MCAAFCCCRHTQNNSLSCASKTCKGLEKLSISTIDEEIANMTLPETIEHHHYRGEEHCEDEDNTLSDDDDIFGPARTLLRRTKNKISMISNELRVREKRKRVLQLCLRKLERIKDSENNLRRSVCIHNTFSRLSNEIKRDKERGQNRNQQQQSYKEMQQKSQKMPKKAEKLDLENLEELCSIDDVPPWDPILKNSEEIEQALSRKRKAEVEKALMSYHQLEKRLKSDIISTAFRDVSEGHNDLNMQCNNGSIISNNNNFLNSFQSNMCGKAAALDSSSNGLFQSLCET